MLILVICTYIGIMCSGALWWGRGPDVHAQRIRWTGRGGVAHHLTMYPQMKQDVGAADGLWALSEKLTGATFNV